jgi:hypothetical protein
MDFSCPSLRFYALACKGGLAAIAAAVAFAYSHVQAQCTATPYACGCNGIVSCFPRGCPAGCAGDKSKPGGRCYGAQQCPVTHTLPPDAEPIAKFPPDSRYQEVISQPAKYEMRSVYIPVPKKKNVVCGSVHKAHECTNNGCVFAC